MRLPEDDAQLSRHAFGQMAESAHILNLALAEQGFGEPLRDRLIEIWWESVWKAPPNAAEFLKEALKLIGSPEDGNA